MTFRKGVSLSFCLSLSLSLPFHTTNDIYKSAIFIYWHRRIYTRHIHAHSHTCTHVCVQERERERERESLCKLELFVCPNIRDYISANLPRFELFGHVAIFKAYVFGVQDQGWWEGAIFNTESATWVQIWVAVFWFGLVLWHINHCMLFNTKSIFIHVNSSTSNNLV